MKRLIILFPGKTNESVHTSDVAGVCLVQGVIIECHSPGILEFEIGVKHGWVTVKALLLVH